MNALRLSHRRAVGDGPSTWTAVTEASACRTLRPARDRILLATETTIAVAYSDNGQLVATTHGDHSVRVFSIRRATLAPLRVLRGHARTPWALAWLHGCRRDDILASGDLAREDSGRSCGSDGDDDSAEEGGDSDGGPARVPLAGTGGHVAQQARAHIADVIIWDVAAGVALASVAVGGHVSSLLFQPASRRPAWGAAECEEEVEASLGSEGRPPLLLLIATGRRLCVWDCAAALRLDARPARDVVVEAAASAGVAAALDLQGGRQHAEAAGVAAAATAAVATGATAATAPLVPLPVVPSAGGGQGVALPLATFSTRIRAMRVTPCGTALLLALDAAGGAVDERDGMVPDGIEAGQVASALFLWLWDADAAGRAVQAHSAALSDWLAAKSEDEEAARVAAAAASAAAAAAAATAAGKNSGASIAHRPGLQPQAHLLDCGSPPLISRWECLVALTSPATPQQPPPPRVAVAVAADTTGCISPATAAAAAAVGLSAPLLGEPVPDPGTGASELRSAPRRRPESALAVSGLGGGASSSGGSDCGGGGIALEEWRQAQHHEFRSPTRAFSAQPPAPQRLQLPLPPLMLPLPPHPRRGRVASLDIVLEPSSGLGLGGDAAGAFGPRPPFHAAPLPPLPPLGPAGRQRSFSAADAETPATSSAAVALERPHVRPPVLPQAHAGPQLPPAFTARTAPLPSYVPRVSSSGVAALPSAVGLAAFASMQPPRRPRWRGLSFRGPNPHLRPCIPDEVLLCRGGHAALADALAGAASEAASAASLALGATELLRALRQCSDCAGGRWLGLAGPVLVDPHVSLCHDAGMCCTAATDAGVAIALLPPRVPLGAILGQAASNATRAEARREAAGPEAGSCVSLGSLQDRLASLAQGLLLVRGAQVEQALATASGVAPFAVAAGMSLAVSQSVARYGASLPASFWPWLRDALLFELQQLPPASEKQGAASPHSSAFAPPECASASAQLAVASPRGLADAVAAAVRPASSRVGGVKRRRSPVGDIPLRPRHRPRTLSGVVAEAMPENRGADYDAPRLVQAGELVGQSAILRATDCSSSALSGCVTWGGGVPGACGLLLVSLWQQLAWRVAVSGSGGWPDQRDTRSSSLGVSTLTAELLGCGALHLPPDRSVTHTDRVELAAPVAVLSLGAILLHRPPARPQPLTAASIEGCPALQLPVPLAQSLSVSCKSAGTAISRLPCGFGWPGRASAVLSCAPGRVRSVQLLDSGDHVLCAFDSRPSQQQQRTADAGLRPFLRIMTLGSATGSVLFDLRSPTTLPNAAIPVPARSFAGGGAAFVYGTHRGQVRLVGPPPSVPLRGGEAEASASL